VKNGLTGQMAKMYGGEIFFQSFFNFFFNFF
jgi:hypothetical protein